MGVWIWGKDLFSITFWSQMFFMFKWYKELVCDLCTEFFVDTKLAVSIFHIIIMDQVGIPHI